jgi:hypothetical protein
MEQSETPPRELTLEEAVALAILLQKNERLVPGALSSRPRPAPNHPDALHYAGVLAHQQGHNDEAVALIERSRGRAGSGGLLQQPASFSSRPASCRRATRISRRSPSTRGTHYARNLGVLLRATGKPLEAGRISHGHSTESRAHRRVSTWHAERVEANRGSRRVLLQGDHARPKHWEATASGARALRAGDIDEAVQIFDEWLDEEPGDPIARMRAACGSRRAGAHRMDCRAFDSFASSGSSTCHAAPALVATMLENSGLRRRTSSMCWMPAAAPDSRSVVSLCAPIGRR